MAKAKRFEGESLLPEPIVQHIQSFLSGKEAARTMILSKSWCKAWLTHPNLEFDFNRRNFGTADAFVMFMNKTLERYQRLKLKIESLRLRMTDACYGEEDVGERYNFSVTGELIGKAMEMGASDLDIGVHLEHHSLILLHEVLVSENLVRLSVSGCEFHRGEDPCIILFRALPLSPFIEFVKQHVWSVVVNPRCAFHKLEYLFLEELDFDSSFFHDFSSKFPCLKDLALHDCGGFRSINIYSLSLECISIMEMDLRWAKLEVPNIRKFAFSGSNFPCLCFKIDSRSRTWQSNISITYSELIDSWFLKLKKFLKRLCLSKISLSLEFLEWSDDVSYEQLLPEPVDAGDVQILPQPSVENLMLSVLEPSSELLDGLFWSCRPKFITGYHPMSCTIFERKANNVLLELLWKTLAQERSENCCIRSPNMPNLHDLVEINVELFEESLAGWLPLAWKTLMDASASPRDEHKIRFQLRWGPEPSTFT